MKIDKTKFKDKGGRFLTQSLFIEYQYDKDVAVFTLEEDDKLYKGKTFISLKTKFINAEDPHEYQFAKENLYNWEHWQRICGNKWCLTHIDKWREELEIAMASRGVQSILDLAESGNFQAAKYAADRQWTKRKAGRPSKEEITKQASINQRIADEFAEDAERVGNVIGLQ